jgi:hypothetical protein
MDHLFFTISLTYDIELTSLQVDLCAEIEMPDDNTCIVHSIRRIDTNESSLLPVLTLTKTGNTWIHSDNGKESKIGKVIGEGIDRHRKILSEKRDEIKNN